MDDLATRGRPSDPRRGVRVAVDAMGGDHGPSEVVPGSLAYARANPQDTVLLVGAPEVLSPLVGPGAPANVRIVPASELIGMDEHPARALVRGSVAESTPSRRERRP